MSDIAQATELPDVGALQPPPDLPDVGSLKAAPAPQSNYPSAIFGRLAKGNPVSAVVTKLANGFATGYGDAFKSLTAADQQAMIDAGIKPVTPEQQHTVPGALRFMGQQLGASFSAVKDGVMALFPAVLEAGKQGAAELATQSGAAPETAGRVGEETAGFLEFLGNDAHVNMILANRGLYSEVTRVARLPDGNVVDQHIGPVPTPPEAAVQAQNIETHYGILGSAAVVQKAYDAGVLPAEIHTDAAVNPTVLGDLAAGEVPKAYPVQDWTGAASEAPKGEPVPTGPTLPKPLKPIPGTGEEKVRGLSESIELAAKEDLGALPTYKVSSNEVNLSNAEDFFTRDPEYAMQVAMGQKAAPNGIMPEAVLQRALTRANESGDVEMQKSLANSGLTTAATTMGQRIQMLSNIDKDDPVMAMQQVQQARRDALAAKGVDVAANENAAIQEYAPIRAAARAPKPNAWNAFITSIQCAE